MATAQQDLKAFCTEYAQKYQRAKDDLQSGLEYFAVHVFAQEDAFVDSLLGGEKTQNVDLSDYHTGGQNDLSIDGLLFNSTFDTLHFVQTKYVKAAPINADDLEEARAFFGCLDSWMNDAYVDENANPKLLDILQQVNLSPQDQSIVLSFVTSKVLGDDQRMHDLANSVTQAFAERGLNVDCRVYGSTELVQHHQVLQNALGRSSIPTIGFKVSTDFMFEFSGSQRVLVTAIKGNAIADIYHQTGVKSLLFNSNIRLALSSGKINPRIVETAKSDDEAGNFFYYNNGITATCSSYVLDEDGTITAEHFQVVNGAQTVNALQRALFKSKNPDVYVLLRLIETDESGKRKDDFAEKITRYQNTQNPVKESDFYSNDDFQIYLRDNLSKTLSGKAACSTFWYCHKRGFVPSAKAGVRVGLEELGMLRHAALFKPMVSYGSPKQLWDGSDGDRGYWEAFGRDGDPCTSWDDEELWQIAWLITVWLGLKNDHKELLKQKRAGLTTSEETGHLAYLARYITSLAFAGLQEATRLGDAPPFSTIMASKTTFDAFSAETVKIARRVIRNRIEDLRSEKAAARPTLNFARDDSEWDRAYKKMLGDMTAEGIFTAMRSRMI
ncbi:MAG TPA: AIPR family protein [Acidimicrobiales bacterium]